MSAAPHNASPNPQPTPPVGQAQGALSTTSAHLLTIVQTLITFGRRLAETLASNPSPQLLLGFTCVFRTRDLALIMARIMRGLRLARALEQRLLRNARQIDNPRVRLYVPRPATRRAKPQPDPTTPEDLLARLPTAEEIAEQIRRRPIGAVLADICRDLGIGPAHPAFSQIFLAIAAHRGNILRLLEDIIPHPRPVFLPGAATAPQPQNSTTGPP